MEITLNKELTVPFQLIQPLFFEILSQDRQIDYNIVE